MIKGILFLSIALERIVEFLRQNTKIKKVPALLIVWVFSFLSLFFWGKGGVLGLISPINKIWDSIFTSFIITAGSKITHDLLGLVEGKYKEVKK